MSTRGRTLVVIPTYNERDHITDVLNRLFAAVESDVDVMIVDDASPDRTTDVVRRHPGASRITLIERPAKLGLGGAYLDAFGRALDEGYEFIVQLDADLSHDPADIPRLLAALGGADLVIGSRYVPGGRIDNWSRTRRALSRAGNSYARACFGWAVQDATSGFRAYRADALRAAALAGVRSEGYAFQIEMVFRLLRTNRRVIEVPITFIERHGGRSKLSRGIVLEALWRVPGWGLRYRWQRRGRPDG
jgi:dolichol-phosphate mannosyltransferase